jgi:AraC family transcriptional regulator of arabinose operon
MEFSARFMEDPAMASLHHPSESMHPVVNRMIGGYFTEGPGYSTWRTNGTDDFLLIHTVAGSGRFGAEKGELLVGPGDSVLLRPGARHDYRTTPDEPLWEFAFAHFHARSDWLPLLDWPAPLDGIGLIHTEGEMRRRVGSALRKATRMRFGALARAELFAANALEDALLWLDTQNSLTNRTDERVLSVLEHVGAHLAEPLDVEQLARVAHLSASRLTHLFTEHLGISPQRYVERERMLLAQQLLDLTDRSIAGIAAEVGWDDPLYFSQRFRRFAGVSPSEYRKRGRDRVRQSTVH